MKKEEMSNGKPVYVFDRPATVEEVSEFARFFFTVNKVDGVVRVTANTENVGEPTTDLAMKMINEKLQEREEYFRVAWNNPDFDGARKFLEKRFEEGCTVWVAPSEAGGDFSEILTYNRGNKKWPHRWVFKPGEYSPKEITNWLYKKMYDFGI